MTYTQSPVTRSLTKRFWSVLFIL